MLVVSINVKKIPMYTKQIDKNYEDLSQWPKMVFAINLFMETLLFFPG